MRSHLGCNSIDCSYYHNYSLQGCNCKHEGELSSSSSIIKNHGDDGSLSSMTGVFECIHSLTTQMFTCSLVHIIDTDEDKWHSYKILHNGYMIMQGMQYLDTFWIFLFKVGGVGHEVAQCSPAFTYKAKKSLANWNLYDTWSVGNVTTSIASSNVLKVLECIKRPRFDHFPIIVFCTSGQLC